MVNSSSRLTCTMEGPSSIEVLRRQELSSHYQSCDYLRDVTTTTARTSATVSPSVIRREMLDWVIKITSFLKLNDDLAIRTATLLDRFLQTHQGSCCLTSAPSFRLATMACFYLTVKVHDEHNTSNCNDNNDTTTIVNAELMAALSQGVFCPEEVEEMEVILLQALDWHISPPTALTFVREFLELIPCSVSTAMKESAYELCRIQIQQSCLDYSIFCLHEASTIAYVALQNALRSLGMDAMLVRHVSDICSFATHTDFGGRNNNSSDENDGPSPKEDELAASLYQAIAPRHVKNQQQRRRRRPRRKQNGLSKVLFSFNSHSNNNNSRMRQKHHDGAWLDESPCSVADRVV